jgi:hypothetical protein
LGERRANAAGLEIISTEAEQYFSQAPFNRGFFHQINQDRAGFKER